MIPGAPFIIDCDTGRDDALTIWSALSLHMNLVGVVASYGNVGLDSVIDNCARVLALARRDDIPLFAGAAAAGSNHKGYTGIVQPRQKISGNGLCNLELPKPARPLPAPLGPAQLGEQIAALAQAHGPLHYVIIGPATNFAAICDALGDDIKQHVSGVTMMGGKLDALWDEMPGADFNLVSDPFAVRTIFERGFAIRFVPMNVTWPIMLPLPALEALPEAADIVGKTAKDLMIAHAKNFAPEPVFRFHDPSVTAALEQQLPFSPERLDIVCDETSDNFGRLVDGAYDAFILEADDRQRDLLRDTVLQSLGLAV